MLIKMFVRILLALVIGAALFVSGFMTANAAKPTRVYELRTYTTYDGKLETLLTRFRDHTTRLFEKHGMKNVGYWIPQDDPQKKNVLIYLLSHESRESARKAWEAFRADPEWKKVQAASEAAGKINQKVESVFLDPADFSALQ